MGFDLTTFCLRVEHSLQTSFVIGNTTARHCDNIHLFKLASPGLGKPITIPDKNEPLLLVGC
jgi:hypothetical protein